MKIMNSIIDDEKRAANIITDIRSRPIKKALS
jgi:hypothetical protein